MRMNNEGLRSLDCTASTRLLFELKRAAGQRDVMISYTHSHLAFARKLRQSLEEANVTTWLDLMDPSGIGGGAVWREEIARGITNASVVLCILTEDYASSEWCLKELAQAKQVGTPILAVSTEGAIVDENLQVYLYTRQIVPFEPAIVGLRRDGGRIEYDYDENSNVACFWTACVTKLKSTDFSRSRRTQQVHVVKLRSTIEAQ
ncbi:TIR domain [Phytophthora infestans]|uniref:TIR domain n=1 Tax=Phytophthora infestans TaxID=4787 RepID=A0A833W9S6_PHYIN|nr:TIR domain [Phytophthora infestans]